MGFHMQCGAVHPPALCKNLKNVIPKVICKWIAPRVDNSSEKVRSDISIATKSFVTKIVVLISKLENLKMKYHLRYYPKSSLDDYEINLVTLC